jgi:very-short-patch-repair endonuclease
VTPYVIADALDDAIRRGLCRAGEVAEIADARAGERGTAGIRRVLDRVLTEPEDVRYRLERETLRAIRAAGFEVVAQFAVEVDGEDYVIDFAIPHLMVGLEVKGWEPRRTRTAFDRDAEREAALRSIGWMLLPVTSRTKMPTLVRRLRRIALLSSRTANLPADGQGKLAVHAEGGRLRGAGTMA